MVANRAAAARTDKSCLSDQIKALDLTADSVGLSDSGWFQRYALEAALMAIRRQEELYWHQRGRLTWNLKGDALTAYLLLLLMVDVDGALLFV